MTIYNVKINNSLILNNDENASKIIIKSSSSSIDDIQGVFFNWYPPKKLKYGKPRLGESTAT